MRPVWKSNAAPTPTNTGAFSSARCSAIQTVCLGQPSATQTTSGCVALMRATMAASSSGERARNGGAYVPAVRRPGKRASSTPASCSATPSAPP